MRYYQAIDLYCERLDPSLLAEPLNVISNAAFFVAAWMLWRLWREVPNPNPALPLIILIGVVGLGSTLFHLFANGLTMMMDVIPITIFVLAYLWIALRYLIGCNRLSAIIGLMVFILLAMSADTVPAPYRLNGSIAYMPCLITIGILAYGLRKINPDAARLMAMATAIFALSITLRSVDMLLCPILLFGTHMFWHVLNGFTLFLLTKTVILHSRSNYK